MNSIGLSSRTLSPGASSSSPAEIANVPAFPIIHESARSTFPGGLTHPVNRQATARKQEGKDGGNLMLEKYSEAPAIRLG